MRQLDDRAARWEWGDLTPTREADTPTLRALNAHAAEHGHFAVSGEGVKALDPDAIHVGIPFYVFDLADADETGGRPLPKDGWLGVAWAAMVQGGGGTGMFIACRASAYFELPEGTLPDKHLDQLMTGARRYMENVAAKGRFIIED
ncbi:MAG TPA: hypothetical protein VID51_06230 [Solirubrobacterales bacterium]|jgi:hypothetical protein